MHTQPTVESRPSASDLAPESPAVFAIMWAAAHMIHVATHAASRLSDPTQIAVFAAALLVIYRPKSDRLLLVLAVCQIIDWWSLAPLNPDHWTLVMAANAILILGALWQLGFRSEASSIRAPLLVTMVTPLRVVLLIAYGAAALAKWNGTFVDPFTSCAAELFDMANYGLFDNSFAPNSLAVVSSIFAETMTFLLLLVPRTRRIGARLGLLFHSMVSLSPLMFVADFTTAVSALFVLFLPASDVSRAVGWLKAANTKSWIVARLSRHRWILPAVLLFVGGVLGHLSELLAAQMLWAVVTTYQIGFVLLPIMRVSRLANDEHTAPAVGLTAPARRSVLVAAPVLAFVAFTAANPYLGLRTTGAFTMFSNLRTEAGVSNHFLGSHPVAGYQDDLFRLTSSNSAYLQEAADNGDAVPVDALHGWAEDAEPTTFAEGTIDGQLVRWTVVDSAEIVGESSFFERYFLSFRLVNLDGHQACGN